MVEIILVMDIEKGVKEDIDISFEVSHTLEDIISQIQHNETKLEVRLTIEKECDDMESDNCRLSKKLCFLCDDYEDNKKGNYLFTKVCEIFIHPLERFLERRKHNYVKSSVMDIVGFDKYKKIKFILDAYGFVFSIMYEMYRTGVSVFLIIFVQQNCGTETCGLFENIFTGNKFNDAVFIISIITFVIYIALNAVETGRESILKNCFTITKTSPGIIGISDCQLNEVDELEQLIKTQNVLMQEDRIEKDINYGVIIGKKHPIYNNNFTNHIKKLLERQYKLYRLFGTLFFGLYFINLLLSSTTILINNSNNQKTYFGLVTNTVIFLPKLYDILMFMMMDKYDTTSTYIRTYAKYNNYNENAFNIVQNEVLRNSVNYVVWQRFDNWFIDEDKNGFSEDGDWEKYGDYSKFMDKINW